MTILLIGCFHIFFWFTITAGAHKLSKVSPHSLPYFAEKIPNITVAAGRDISIPCVVENLGNYRVAWIHTNRYTLLTLQNRVITRNSRYRVTHSNYRTWWLHISDVEFRDKGQYMCQINTSPMKSQVGYVEVVVPPKVDDALTSSDSDVREGSDIALRCVASGHPPPTITWRREDGQNISLGKYKVSTTEGDVLNISKASRLHMGAYLCIASNGILPAVSKRIVLRVNFPPMIWIPNQLVGAPLGSDVTLDCILESHPKSVTYWTMKEGQMLLSNTKYNIIMMDSGLYKLQMRLQIRELVPDDFELYTCVAKNSLGETEGTIRLYEIPPPSSPASPGPEAVVLGKPEKLRNGVTFIRKDMSSDGTDIVRKAVKELKSHETQEDFSGASSAAVARALVLLVASACLASP